MAVEAHYPAGRHRWSILLAFATLLLVVAGGLVTSRDAGLSVPDWPLSYGKLMPPSHRMVATTVGLLTIVSVIWLFRTERRIYHISFSPLVAAVILWFSLRILVHYGRIRELRLAATTLVGVAFCQVFLGIAAYMSRLPMPFSPCL